VVFNLFCTAIHYSNPLQPNEPHLKLQQSKCNAAVYIKYLLATIPEMVHDPQCRNSRLKTTIRGSINPLRKFYPVTFSCIHGGRNYNATGKVRKISFALLRIKRKKRSSYVLLGEMKVGTYDPIFHVTSVCCNMIL